MLSNDRFHPLTLVVLVGYSAATQAQTYELSVLAREGSSVVGRPCSTRWSSMRL